MRQLSVENATYIYKNKYQTVHAVADVSYTFVPGRFYAIVGRSGSGKTTLLSLLAGLDLPTTGRIVYDETSIAEMDRNQYRRACVTVIYQSYNLFPLLTVMENVTYPLELCGIPPKEAKVTAAEKIAAVGLNEAFYNRLPSMLSGGEQQRVAIARALASKAEIILADEPTGNLDTENAGNIINMLKQLAAEGYCIIVVTHDLAIAESADEVIQMKDGAISMG